MMLNEKKTMTVIFNTARSKDFTPRLKNSKGKVYKNEEQFKLLGVDFSTHFRNGLSLKTYIKNCIRRAYTNMWILRRLSEFGVSHEHLFLVYKSRIRVHVEINIPLWTFSITQDESRKIEKIQRIAALLILGNQAHKDYYCNLAILETEPLSERRTQMSLKFAKKALKHPVHKEMFKPVKIKTRSEQRVVVPHCRRKRYEKSAIPSLSKLLNENS